uniref:OSJNBb0032D24.7 protein n=1 Tax=Oryza sativa subsp. japonica TaxID=39947 RepID=Q7XNI6_ORYSJ|nr:OSJNBb0032D24.7 [Oryza sativa Japonica Group]
MGLTTGIDDFAFPPGQAYHFGSLDFSTDSCGKISLFDSDSNQSRGDRISVSFGLLNSAEIYSNALSSESAPNHSDESSAISSSELDDLAGVFTSRAPSPRRSRSNLVSTLVRSGSREVGVILQRLGSVSTEELEGYLSSPNVDSRHPTEITDYNDSNYDDDFNNFNNLDEDIGDNYEDNYTPLFFGVFMADNETEEQRLDREANEESA